jgi:thiamine-phosphate pyrophosphorylase
LREKDLSGVALLELAYRLRDLCRRYHAVLLINDRIDIAVAVDADGVHLPVNSFRPADARQLLGPGALIGASSHSLAEARSAMTGGVDFILLGPIFDTPSKRVFGAPLGMQAVIDVAQSVSRPLFAIGGVTAERVPLLRQRGTYGIGVVSAILEAPDPRAAAAALRAAL